MRQPSPGDVVVDSLRGPWERKVVGDLERIVDSDGDVVCTPRKATLLQGEAILRLPEAYAILRSVARGYGGKRRAQRLLAKLTEES